MILTYRQCLEKYGTDYRIKKAIEAGILFQKEKGLYSDKKICSELELMTAKYPRCDICREQCVLLLWLD